MIREGLEKISSMESLSRETLAKREGGVGFNKEFTQSSTEKHGVSQRIAPCNSRKLRGTQWLKIII